MSAIRIPAWFFVAAVLLIAMAAFWALQGSRSGNPARAASTVTQGFDSEATWINLIPYSGLKAHTENSGLNDAVSTGLVVGPARLDDSMGVTLHRSGVILGSISSADETDTTALPIQEPSCSGVSSPDGQIQLSQPTGVSDGKSVHMITTATIVRPEDGESAKLDTASPPSGAGNGGLASYPVNADPGPAGGNNKYGDDDAADSRTDGDSHICD